MVCEGEDDISGVKADSLKIATGDGLTVSLDIDQQTHRPIRATYAAQMAATSERGREGGQVRSEEERAQESQVSNVEIYLSEYKAVAEKGFGDIWLPHQVTRTRDGLTVEDMHIKKFQLNPHINAKQFEQKR
jgi:hypothetical protein